MALSVNHFPGVKFEAHLLLMERDSKVCVCVGFVVEELEFFAILLFLFLNQCNDRTWVVKLPHSSKFSSEIFSKKPDYLSGTHKRNHLGIQRPNCLSR